MGREFQAKEVEYVTGVKRIRLFMWMERGFFSPSIYKATRTGERNVFSTEDLYFIVLFKKLVEAGLSRSVTAVQIKKLFGEAINFKSVKKHIAGKNTFAYFIVARRFDDDDTLVSIHHILDMKEEVNYLHRKTQDFYDKGYDQVCTLNIGKIINEVDTRISELT